MVNLIEMNISQTKYSPNDLCVHVWMCSNYIQDVFWQFKYSHKYMEPVLYVKLRTLFMVSLGTC